MEDIPEADPPRTVELDRAHALVVVWDDRPPARFAVGDLRRACPCAECRGLRELGRVVGPPDDAVISATGAELVGNWGLSITWSDGHATGIYPWGLLRAWADDPATGDGDGGDGGGEGGDT